MRKLDEVMLKHMRHITFNEKRPFSYLDFGYFKVQGKDYGMKHGTFRNKISRLARYGIAQLAYKSNVAFYTLNGVSVGKHTSKMTPTMTRNHMGVNSVIKPHSVIVANTDFAESSPPAISHILSEIPLCKNTLHDIHFKFSVPDIWKILYLSKKYSPNDVSRDITVNTLNISQLRITTTVHRTDTVTVIVACSNLPVAADTHGLIRLSNALTRVEERLSRVLDECGSLIPGGYETIPIPNNDTWKVTMWHFGKDSSIEYSGPKFCTTWKDGQNDLARVYSKKMKSNRILRSEEQQYPQKCWKDIMEIGD
jgi:hypothetical protein